MSMAPRGKALLASAASTPRSIAAASNALSPQPSKGTWAMAPSISLSRRALFSVMTSLLASAVDLGIGKVAMHLLDEHQLGQIGHSHRVEHAIQMIAFMLNHASMKAGGFPLDHFAV